MTVSEKQRHRDEARARRKVAATNSPNAGARLRDNILAAIPIPPEAIVAGFWPMGDEIDVRPVMEALLARGNPVCLPVVAGKGRPLVFRDWTMETVLEPAGFGTSIPPTGAPEVKPDILLVPLLAFDREGYRVGYGGGFYDMTLEALRREKTLLAVGVAYAAQEVPAVPREAHDQPLDWIATEEAAWQIERAA